MQSSPCFNWKEGRYEKSKQEKINAESHTNARGQLCIYNLNERDVPNLYLPIPFVKYKPDFSFSSTFRHGM